MRVRSRTLILLTVAITFVSVAAIPSAADAAMPQQLFVSASEGSDANLCTAAAPCATVQHAVDVAGTTPSAIGIYVGAPGASNPGPVIVAAGQQITLAPYGGDGPVTLSAPADSPVITNDGVLAVAALALTGGTVGIEQNSGQLSLQDVDAFGSSDGVRVDGGSVTETSSAYGSYGGAVPIELNSGSFVASNVSSLDSITQTGGRLVIDASTSARSSVAISGGSALIENSRFEVGSSGLPAVAVSGTGNATISRSSFFDDGSPAVDGSAAVLTVLASSFLQSQTPVAATQGGELRMAASALDDGVRPECEGPVLDGGYNSATDASCAFTEPTSRNSAPKYQLQNSYNPAQARQDFTGPTPIVAPTNIAKITSAGTLTQADSLIDAIPLGTVASFDPNIQLCDPSTTFDEVGQYAPVGARCDIGSVELQPSHVKLVASSANTNPGKAVTLVAKVTADVSDLHLLDGDVTFTDAGRPIKGCADVRIYNETTASCLVHPRLGAQNYTADFISLGDQHTATSNTQVVRAARAKVAVTLSMQSARAGKRSQVTGHVEDAATHHPADVRARLYNRTDGHNWRPIGPATSTGRSGRFHKSIRLTHGARYQLRTQRTSQYDPGTSGVIR